MFLKNMNIHNLNTRNKLDFHVILHSQTVREFIITIYGVKLWNNLPAFKKNINHFNSFRSKRLPTLTIGIALYIFISPLILFCFVTRLSIRLVSFSVSVLNFFHLYCIWLLLNHV